MERRLETLDGPAPRNSGQGAASGAIRDVVRLVLDARRAGANDAGDGEGGAFLLRRAEAEVAGGPSGRETELVHRVLAAAREGEAASPESVRALLAWAGLLESREHLAEASAVLNAAAAARPGDAELVLHRARLARKGGRIDEARRLYDRVRSRGGGRMSRLAAVGQALLAPDPERALGRALRRARTAGDREAAAVAQEERARARRRAGDVGGALRDYGVAAARFCDPLDRGRIGHEVADLLVARGDPLAARTVLLAVVEDGHPEQVARARVRLRGVSRTLGDELGMRRWAGLPAPDLVSMGPPARRPKGRSVEPWVRRGLDRLTGLVAPG